MIHSNKSFLLSALAISILTSTVLAYSMEKTVSTLNASATASTTLEVNHETFFSKLKEHYYLYSIQKNSNKSISPTLDCLFKRIGNKKLTDMGESLADIDFNKKAHYYTHFRYQELVNYLFEMSNEIIDKEINLCSEDYTVYYHAQKLVFILLEDLKQILHELNTKEKLKHFYFVRQVNTDNLNNISQYKDVKEFLRKNYQCKVGWNYEPSIYECLLAVNNNFFANMHAQENSSFFYFLKDANIKIIDILAKIKELFLEYNLEELYLKLEPKINNILEILKQKETIKTGLLLQIFIPNDLQRNLVYGSFPHGHPTDKLVWRFAYSLISRVANYLCGAHLDRDAESRILLNPKYFMNPQNGIKIFRYTNENCETMRKYKDELEDLKKIIYDYCGSK